MKILRYVLAAAIVAAVAPAPSQAQRAAAMQASAAPVASRMAVGVRKSVNAPAPVPRTPRADTRQNRGLMLFGGAAMLTGAVVGGDAGTLISVGGAVVFLWGLYQFLQ